MIVSQVKNCRKTFESGSLLQILGRITTSHANLNTAELRDGGSVVRLSQSGKLLVQAHFCGYTGSVSVCALIILSTTYDCRIHSGGREEHPLVHHLFMFSLRELKTCHHLVPRSSRIFATFANWGSRHLPSFIVTSETTKRGTAVDYFRLSWFSFVGNPMLITTSSPNSIQHMIMARKMQVILN